MDNILAQATCTEVVYNHLEVGWLIRKPYLWYVTLYPYDKKSSKHGHALDEKLSGPGCVHAEV
jgi:hypothetical protein